MTRLLGNEVVLHPDLDIGIVFPQTEVAGDAAGARAVADAAESLGYDHLVVYDHVLGAEHGGREPELWGPYDEHDPFHDPFVLLSHLAARTERLRFATGILILPQRQTALVARQAADLAILSDDRFRLGVGVGWNWVEYDALGQDFSTRGRRLDEQIGLLRRLWSEDVVDVTGEFDRVDRAGIPPRPSAAPPIWVGGFGEAAFRRCARLGDGFFFAGGSARMTEGLERLRVLTEEAGRPWESMGREALILARGGPGELAHKVEAWAAAGGTHASVVTMGLELDSPEAHVDYLGLAADAVAGG